MKSMLVLLSLLCMGFLFSGDTQRESRGPEWLDDLDAAFELAAEEDRPLLIVFR